jgi:putative ABC transport system substrate-binding protein
MAINIRRRQFIATLGGAAAWPVAARAQQGERMRRVGVLMNSKMNADQQTSVSAFVQALQQLGWTYGRNVRIDIRWGRGDPAEIRRHAEDLVAQASDVLVATGNAGMPALLRATSTVPIVFAQVAGGLMSYGYDVIQQFRSTAGYVDRILKGRNPQTFQCRRPLNTSW